MDLNEDSIRLVYDQDVKPILQHSTGFIIAFWVAWMTEQWTLPFLAILVSGPQLAWRSDLRISESLTDSQMIRVPLVLREIQLFAMEAMLMTVQFALQLATAFGSFKFYDRKQVSNQIHDFLAKDGLWFLRSSTTVSRISLQMFVYSCTLFVQIHTCTNLFRMSRSSLIRVIWRHETKEMAIPILTILLGHYSLNYLGNFMGKTRGIFWFCWLTLLCVWTICLLNASLWSNDIPFVRTNDRLGYLWMIQVTSIHQMFGHVVRNTVLCWFLLYHHCIPGSRDTVAVVPKLGESSGGMISNWFNSPKNEVEDNQWILLIDPASLFSYAFMSVQLVRHIKHECRFVRLIRSLEERRHEDDSF